jgi:hypothetical protein
MIETKKRVRGDSQLVGPFHHVEVEFPEVWFEV